MEVRDGWRKRRKSWNKEGRRRKKERRKSWIQQKGVSVKQTIPCYTLNMVINYIKTFATEGSKRRIESCVRIPQKPSKQPINTSKQPINLTAEGPNRVSEGKAPPDKGIERGPRHAVNAHQLSRCSTVAIEHCHRDPHHGNDDHQQPRHRHARQCQRPADDKNVLLTKR